MGRESGNGSGFESKEPGVSGNPVRRIMSYFDDEASNHSAEDIRNEVRMYYSRPEDDLIKEHMISALELLKNHRDAATAKKVAQFREILHLPEKKKYK